MILYRLYQSLFVHIQVRSQFVLKSIRSHFGQLVLIFRSVRTQQYFLRSIRPHLVNSYSSWSIRPRFGQFVLR